MTVDDLHAQVTDALAALSTFYASAGTEIPDGYAEKVAALRADLSFKHQTFEIATRYGIKSAMLFKLSDGHIDPRNQ